MRQTSILIILLRHFRLTIDRDRTVWGSSRTWV